MDHQNEKCVMVIDEELPTGIIANTAGIMGITLGKKTPRNSWAGCIRPERKVPSGHYRDSGSHPEGK